MGQYLVLRPWILTVWVQMLALLFQLCLSQKLFNLTLPQFPHK